MQKEKKLVNELKSIIDIKGLNYLKDKPDKIYKSLLDSAAVDAKIALAFYTSLLQGIPDYLEQSHSDKEIQEHI